MPKLKIILYGQVPSQKNGKMIAINKHTNRPFVASNKNVREWKQNVALQLTQGKYECIKGQVKISIIFYNKDQRKRDLDNMTTSVLDTLKNSNIIEDDNCFIVNEVHSYFGGVEKYNPRAEVIIEQK